MTADARPVAVYLRLSKSDDASTSLEKQRANVLRKVAQEFPGATVVEFVDDGVSASKGRRRPDFETLLARVAAGEFRVVLVDTQDRVTRERGGRALWDLWTACEDGRADLDGASEPIDLESAAGEFMAGMRSQLARFEARRLGERMKATNALRRTQGVRALGGRAPFGLRREGDHFRPDPTTAPLVIDAAERIADGKVSMRGIAREWTAAGVSTPQGSTTWPTRTISRLFRNPAIAGMTPSRYADGGVLLGDDGLPLIDAEGALLPLPLWDRVQAALSSRTPVAPKPYEGPRLLLHGLAVDDHGHRMYRFVKRADRTDPDRPDRVFYASKVAGCDGRTILADRLERHVLDAFRSRYPRVPHGYNVELAPGRDSERLTLIRAEVSRLAAALPTASPAERATLLERLASLSAAEASEAAKASEPVRSFVSTGRYLPEALDDALALGDVAEARDILAAHLEAVVISAGKRGTAAALEERVRLDWKD